ncbi:MAG: PD40 domain-containing protein [Bacteroidia bacterium]|nr:PD40 domain-containing protein [Bacteroidia bacterium]
MKISYTSIIGLLSITSLSLISCKKVEIASRSDGALRLKIETKGSVQNPAWSPNNNSVVVTNFLNGYNTDPADLLIFDINTETTNKLVADGSANVNLPGSSWNAVTHKITFSSSREPHDEIYMIDENGSSGSEQKITERADKMAFEPSFSPDGKWLVFESHLVDNEGNGVITKYKIDKTSSYIDITDVNDDCRQPNWSPAGELILYQKFENGQWNIWVIDTLGNNKTKVTSGNGDKTDASFSPDGKYIVYSSNESGEKYANIYIVSSLGGASVRVTKSESYDGAPSWSPDGKKIIFESSFYDPEKPSLWTPADPDGTKIWIINSPI